MTSPVEQAVLECLRRYSVADETLVVGVSGGIDSVTLVTALCRVASARNLSIVIVHVNHKLRSHHSDDDAAFVSQIASDLGCHVVVIDAPTLQHRDISDIGIEAAARDQRYSAFAAAAAEHKARFVLTAHSLEDNVETFLMNAARGSGFKGLAAIPESRPLGSEVHVLRPLLGCRRSHIRMYAQETGLAWREDHTNDTMDYTRNRVRNIVLPALEQAIGQGVLLGIHHSATHLRALKDAVEFLILPYRSAFTGDLAFSSDDDVFIEIAPLISLPSSLRSLIVQQYLGLSREDVARICALIDAEVGTLATLSKGLTALRDRNRICIEPPSDSCPVKGFSIEITGSGTYEHNGTVLHVDLPAAPSQEFSTHTVQFDVQNVSPPLIWRTWNDGDRIAPFGMDGKTCLVSDILTNARVPHEQRRRMQVLTDSRGILWICGLRRSDRAPVTEKTSGVLLCRYQSRMI